MRRRTGTICCWMNCFKWVDAEKQKCTFVDKNSILYEYIVPENEILHIRRRKYMKRSIALIWIILELLSVLQAHIRTEKNDFEYMVLLGEEASNLENFPATDVLVIDGDYYTAEDIAYLRSNGTKIIFSYLNIGSLENFRDYYEEYSKYTLGEYDNWPDERWVDVSNRDWQTFIMQKAEGLAQKGFDGFFLDNVDVYDQYPSETIYDGLLGILSELHALNLEIIINGGDTFVRRFIESKGDSHKVFDGVNQEDVYTLYDFSNNKCGSNSEESKEYWEEYLELVSQNGYSVYVLEYADSMNMITDAGKYSEEHGWTCYVADNIELKLNKQSINNRFPMN